MAPWLIAAIAGALLAVVVLAVARITGRRAHLARVAQEPPAPVAPVPARRTHRAARPREIAAVRAAGGDLTGVVLAAEIEHAGDGFRLRALGEEGLLPLEAPTPMPVDAAAVAARSPVASRAHALLCDRLAQHGWEPCGRGAAWYAHRYRRTVSPPT